MMLNSETEGILGAKRYTNWYVDMSVYREGALFCPMALDEIKIMSLKKKRQDQYL